MPSIEHCLFHGQPALRLCADDSAAVTLTLFGGQVLSWTTAAGVEQLYLSPLTRLDGSGAIRGGVPVIFPQFNARGPLPRHGFARTAQWELVQDHAQAQDQAQAEPCSLTLALQHTAGMQALWPHDFDCRLIVALRPHSLALTLTVHNAGSAALSFQAALHTYLAVGGLDGLQLLGLDHCPYEDCTEPHAGVFKPHMPWQPPAAMDRIYFQAPGQLQLRSALGQRLLQHSGFADLVVWNPGAAPAGTPADLPADGHRHFLCVEAAQIGQPVCLEAGQKWSGTQTLGALS